MIQSMKQVVDEIKERLSIVDVLSTYIRLEKAGINYKARCPFHNEKTASFFVSPVRNTFHCFGCNVGGDIFTFVEKIEGIDFASALKMLAERAGVTLTDNTFGGENKEARSRLVAIHEEATKFFESELATNLSAKEYLKSRGLTEETMKSWRIGYAKDSWRELSIHLLSLGYNEKELQDAGLVIPSRNGVVDRFRGRIMFPIANISGNIIGFSGRFFVPGKDEKTENAPKYMNSPETELYHKTRVLFGLDKARRAISEKGYVILVEGQMDLIMAHQAKTENTVAVSGTALTEEHLTILSRFTKNIMLAFDSDSAGLKASERAVLMAFPMGLEIKIVRIPGAKDPADVIRDDKELWYRALGSAVHIIDFYVDEMRKTISDERRFKRAVIEKVSPLIGSMKSMVDQAFFVGKLAQTLSLSEEIIWAEVRQNAPQREISKERERGEEKLTFLQNRKSIIAEKAVAYMLSLSAIPEYTDEVEKIKVQFINLPYDDIAKDKERLMFLVEEEGIKKEELLQRLTELSSEYVYEIYKDEREEIMRRLRDLERMKGGDDERKILLEAYDSVTKKIMHLGKK